jgi:nicotinamidase/pyrazinamidase
MNESARPVPGVGDALLVVDVQLDFLPGGSLAVADGAQVIAPLNRCITLFAERQLPVFVTRDWHPRDHCSFRAQGGPWPAHCVADSAGAAFPEALHLPASVPVISKGTRPDVEAYSGFEGTALQQRLGELGVKRLFVGGLATDYCVAQTVLNARRCGFEVVVIEDAIAAVNTGAGDSERAIERMMGQGATFVSSTQLL